MQNASQADGRTSARGWLGPALAIVVLVTVLRIIALAFDRTDLFVDESQYWFWSQHLAFGYFSKPPLIGWVIRLATEIAGSSAPVFVRLPAPLFHAATALILAAITARLRARAAAIWVAAGFVTLPMTAVGSLLISTDTIMFPFLATALLLWLRLCERPARRETALALGVGVALGFAFLAKYAAIYFVVCAPIAALAAGGAYRPRPRVALIAGIAFLVTISPNIIWNILAGLPTVHATADNIGWVKAPEARMGLDWGKFGEFFVAQFGVMGPLSFGLLLWRGARMRSFGPEGRALIAFSLPILAIVLVQALLSRAYANWAVAAYLAGAILVFGWGQGRAGAWLRGTAIVINLLICIALPLMAIWPEAVRAPNGRAVMHRYLGRADLSRWIIGEAKQHGLSTVVARERDVISDLFYNGRDSGLRFYAVPPRGAPQDQFQMTAPLPAGTGGEVLFVTGYPDARCAKGRQPVAEVTPKSGAYKGTAFYAFAVPASCWAAR